MDLVFVTQVHFTKSSNNRIYSVDGTVTVDFWSNYLSVFSNIYIIARVGFSNNTYDDSLIADSRNVKFIEIPDYKGVQEYLKVRRKVSAIIKSEIQSDRAYICRVPGELGRLASQYLSAYKIPYAVEVVGDPWDVFAPHAIKHPLRRFIRILSYFTLKKIVKNSSAALYVTQYSLQKRYPVRQGVFSTYASDVVIENRNIVKRPKQFDSGLTSSRKIKLISVGSLNQMYKSPDVVIKSIKQLKDRGIECTLTWLGDGIFKEEMIELAKEIGVLEDLNFPGHISSKSELNDYLKLSDIFVLVSRTEGLPRAMIEAMALGLPCIGSFVGGIPELLSDRSIILPTNSTELANKVEWFLNNELIMNEEASRNLVKSQEYIYSELSSKRIIFFKAVLSVSN